MRLTFKKIKSVDGDTEQVYPIVVGTGEEIDDVRECIVSSNMDGLTTMTFTVNVLAEEFVEYDTKVDADVKISTFSKVDSYSKDRNEISQEESYVVSDKRIIDVITKAMQQEGKAISSWST